MNLRILTPKILTGYAIAVMVFAVALYAAMVLGPQGRSVTLLCMVGSVSLVAAGTFRWGALTGFPIFSRERGFSLEFLLRNLVMTVLVLGVLDILAGPIWAFVFWIAARK